MEREIESDRDITLFTLSGSICAMEARLKIAPGRPLVRACWGRQRERTHSGHSLPSSCSSGHESEPRYK